MLLFHQSKDYYPKLGMREMADYDILYDVKKSGEVKTIMESLGFSVERYDTTSNHDVYYKKPVSNFEMHRSLFGIFHEDALSNYYSNVSDRLLKDDDNNYGYHFSPEDFYIYMIAHEFKHYSRGGTGIRSLLDTYVFLNRVGDLDWNYINGEFEKLGIKDFALKDRELAFSLFDHSSMATENNEMLMYMLGSGVYGNADNLVSNGIAKSGSRLQYIINPELFMTSGSCP